ncbi:MAG: Vgb family protein [Steroidobacteraceae bacterium]
MFFDGQYIWAAIQNPDGGVLEKISTSGKVLSTTGVGSAPLVMTFDGTNVWVTDYTSSDVAIVRQDGVLIKVISLPSANPEGIVFDGKYVWVANNGVGANSVSKFDAATLNLVATYGTGLNPEGVAYDGANIWVTNSYNNSVWKLDRDTGQQLAGYATGIFPLAIAFDGKNMWIGNGTGVNIGTPVPGSGSLTKIRAADGANLGTFTVGDHVRGLVYDGTSIWACNGNDNTISRLRATGVALLGTYPTGKAPRAAAYDGTKIWVANSGENTLTVFAPQGVVSAAIQTGTRPSGGFDGIAPTVVTYRAVVTGKTVGLMLGLLIGDN